MPHFIFTLSFETSAPKKTYLRSWLIRLGESKNSTTNIGFPSQLQHSLLSFLRFHSQPPLLLTRFRPRLYQWPTLIHPNHLVHLLDAREVGHRSLHWGCQMSVLIVHDQLRGQEAQPHDLGGNWNPTSDMEDRKADGHYIIARSFFDTLL